MRNALHIGVTAAALAYAAVAAGCGPTPSTDPVPGVPDEPTNVNPIPGVPELPSQVEPAPDDPTTPISVPVEPFPIPGVPPQPSPPPPPDRLIELP